MTVSPQSVITVALSPSVVTLGSAQSRQFIATVSGTTNKLVTWSISPAVGTITQSGVYTAPSSVTSQQTVTVRAVSAILTSISATAVVTLVPPTAPPDGAAPSITGVRAVPSSNSAVIEWTTNEPAVSSVQFGTTTSLGQTVSSSTLTTNHRITISGLNPQTAYYYRVTSADAAHNTSAMPASGSYAFTTLASASAPPAPGAGLFAQWKFDEGSGTRSNDSVGSTNPGTIYGATWTPGKNGTALRFDGVDDYVSIWAFDMPGSAMTMSAWFRADVLGNNDPRIISKATGSAEQDHYWMLGTTQVSGASRLRFRLKVGGKTKTLVASSGNVPVNSWVHAVATYDGSNMRLYLNGVQVGSVAASGAITANSGVPVAIGRNPGPLYGAFDGTIDQVRLYTRALAASEVSSLYSGGQ